MFGRAITSNQEVAAFVAGIGNRARHQEPQVEHRNATEAVIGAGVLLVAPSPKKFASEGFTVFAGRGHAGGLNVELPTVLRESGEPPLPGYPAAIIF